MPLLRPLLLVSIVGLLGCTSEPDATNQDGRELYDYYCADCHKESGAGSFLEGIPANTRSSFSEAELVELILHGHPELPDMPKFAQLNRSQAKAIAHYLRSRLNQ